MATLNTWQKISRIIPGLPFGTGQDGAIDISANTTQSLTVKSCSGTLGATSLTIASAGFTNNDIVVIHQSRGTAQVGDWEINKISSGAGTTTLTLSYPLSYTYSDD